MVKNHILEFIAKVTGDLVLHIFRDMSHVEMSGFSFGAHIASRSCRYLFNVTGTKVEFLQGMDQKPNNIFTSDSNDCIDSFSLSSQQA